MSRLDAVQLKVAESCLGVPKAPGGGGGGGVHLGSYVKIHVPETIITKAACSAIQISSGIGLAALSDTDAAAGAIWRTWQVAVEQPPEGS